MVKWLVFVFGLIGFCRQIVGEYNKYDNYTLLKITPHNERQLEYLARLLEDADGGVEFLKRSHGLNISADVLVSPNKKEFLEDYANKYGMPVEYKDYYSSLFESVEDGVLRQQEKEYDFDQYNSYRAMQNYIDKLAKTVPKLVTVENVGESYQGRKMRLVKISTDPKARNPVIFIDAGIHAREWVAPAMAMYIIHRLTHDREARRRELDGVDWYILPLVNPDGYEFSRTGKANRLWRKTRSKSSTEGCIGVDGNRNFGFEWGINDTFHDCDEETYCGPTPFSESETKVVRDIMVENAKRLKLYVSLHSYGQYLIYPWAYTGTDLPKNWKRLHNLALMVSDSVQRAGGRPFNVMSSGQWKLAAGASDDFAFGVIGVPYSYTMVLTDGFEFTFPIKLLETVFLQYYDGFKTFSIQIKKEFGKT